MAVVAWLFFAYVFCGATGAQLHHHQKSLDDSLPTHYQHQHGGGKYQQQQLTPQHSPHSHRHHHDRDSMMAKEQQAAIDALDYPESGDPNYGDYETDDLDRTAGLSSPPSSSTAENGDENDNGGDDDPSLPQPGSYIPSNCSSCIRREELRRRNLEVIKDQILSKLGMQRAPNMTGRLPPRIPPLGHLLDLYGMQGDAPGGGFSSGGFQTGTFYDEEEDDFHARTEKVIAFAQQRKFPPFIYVTCSFFPVFFC